MTGIGREELLLFLLPLSAGQSGVRATVEERYHAAIIGWTAGGFGGAAVGHAGPEGHIDVVVTDVCFGKSGDVGPLGLVEESVTGSTVADLMIK